MLTVGADTPVGFDIYTTLQNDVAINNSGFAALCQVCDCIFLCGKVKIIFYWRV